MSQNDELRQLESVRSELLREFAARAPDVNARFDAIVQEFDGAPVRTFVPVLARRRLREELSHGH